MLLQQLAISPGHTLRCDLPKRPFTPRAFCIICLMFKTKKLKHQDLW